MDRLTVVFSFAGVGCFVLAFVLSGLYPYMITDAKEAEASFQEIAKFVVPEFKGLAESYPVAFAEAFGADEAGKMLTALQLSRLDPSDPETARKRAQSDAAWVDAFAKGIRSGRDLYVGEGCWHCHSQYVRPVANEEQRFGPVLSARHYNNAAQRPVMWGTRRVGPDLTHEGGLRSNDWHVAHFFDPQSTTPGSIMPRYNWYLREGFQVYRRIDPDVADQQGLSEETAHPLPGVYRTREEAEKVIADLVANPPANLEDEVERLFVGTGMEPTAEGIWLISYLQWLGTWDPGPEQEASR